MIDDNDTAIIAIAQFLEALGHLEMARFALKLGEDYADAKAAREQRDFVIRFMRKHIYPPPGRPFLAPIQPVAPVMAEAPPPESEPPTVEAVPEARTGSLVYFIQAISGGPIKIGYTKNLSQRLSTAQTHSPERMIVIASFPGGAAEEGALHWKLKAHRVNGEWYAPAPEVMAEIERITASA